MGSDLFLSSECYSDCHAQVTKVLSHSFVIVGWSQQSDEQQRRLLNENLLVFTALSLGSGLIVLLR